MLVPAGLTQRPSKAPVVPVGCAVHPLGALAHVAPDRTYPLWQEKSHVPPVHMGFAFATLVVHAVSLDGYESHFPPVHVPGVE
jgi:hypothetical protein